MKRLLLLHICVGLFFLALLLPSAIGQYPQPSVWGSLFFYVPNAPNPYPASGYRIYLYRADIGWSQPSFTDSFGRYAHYGVSPGRYFMRVINRANVAVWQQEVIVPSQVPPIVLPSP